MQQPFSAARSRLPPFAYIMQEFSFENDFYYERRKNNDTIVNFKINCSALRVAMTPQMIEDVSQLLVMFQNYFLSKDLKQYRPHRKPIVLDDA